MKTCTTTMRQHLYDCGISKTVTVVADILTARNKAHQFLPFMPVSLAIDTLILPLSRRLLSVFLPRTSSPATFVVCRVREDKYACTSPSSHRDRKTQTDTVQISELESVSAARRTLCGVQLSFEPRANSGQQQFPDNCHTNRQQNWSRRANPNERVNDVTSPAGRNLQLAECVVH